MCDRNISSTNIYKHILNIHVPNVSTANIFKICGEPIFDYRIFKKHVLNIHVPKVCVTNIYNKVFVKHLHTNIRDEIFASQIFLKKF